MANYKKMYLKMAKAFDKAINILIKAQQDAEEIYLSSPESAVQVLPLKEKEHTVK